jgi:protein-tyrosine phosphatase
MLPSKRAVLYAIRVERNTKQNQGCKNIYVVNTVRLEEIRMSDLQIEVYHEGSSKKVLLNPYFQDNDLHYFMSFCM